MVERSGEADDSVVQDEIKINKNKMFIMFC